jgi:hypothetical protein
MCIRRWVPSVFVIFLRAPWWDQTETMSFHNILHSQVIEAIIEKQRVLINPRPQDSRSISLFLFQFVRAIQPLTTIAKNGIWQISLKESNTCFSIFVV